LTKSGQVKLTDFGWCCLDAIDDDKKTYCGTPAYISPEMKIGEAHDNKVDIWAYGVLLYEIAY
jgi:serine/threonine protein kinase